jgi:uncharacterized protein YdcH (DUF465 family)
MADAEDFKDLLLETNDEFRQLAAKHHALDDQLGALSTKPYLTDEEQIAEVTLKKQKLYLKDRMEDIVRRYRNSASGAALPA